jgi:hypothetical protein
LLPSTVPRTSLTSPSMTSMVTLASDLVTAK